MRKLGLVLSLLLLTAGAVFYGLLARDRGLFPAELAQRALPKVFSATKDVHPSGYWDEVAPAQPEHATDPELTPGEIERLMSLPYAQGYQQAPDLEHVTVHVRGAVHEGLNVYASGHDTEAVLMDMAGSVVHRWSLEAEEAFGEPPQMEKLRFWRRVLPIEDGHLLAIQEYTGVLRVDADSNLVWSHAGRNHHDLDVDKKGNVYVLGQRNRLHPWEWERMVIADDLIQILSPEGELQDELSVFDCFAESDYVGFLDLIAPPGDVFHTNTLTILDGSHEARSPAFREGNLLVSLRALNVVAVIDPAARKVVWALAGMGRRQHEPVMLDSGRMLLFDNNTGESFSRVLEFDPFTQEILWSYEGTSETPFYTRIGGSNQRLPNGNTLITESTAGRAFEITPDGTIVWEFISPHRAGPDDRLIATLFDLVRLDPDYRIP